jgi:uncharacterized glyoxalase superfamily protein PhnB
MSLKCPAPLLRMFDEALSREFYVTLLGFEVLFEHRYEPGLPLYMAVKRGGCELHLTGHHGDCSPGAGLRIACDDIDAFAAEINAKHHRHARAQVQTMPWGTRDFTVTDPSGNRLTFTNAVSL